MAKQLNVNLNIDAQTGKAKQSLNELNKILTDIQTNRTITVNDKSLQEAKQAASDLKFHLAQATSVDTGKLNLGAFSQSLKKAGQDLNTLYSKLSAVGPEGQKAFLALSQSIVQADHASLTLGNRLSQLGTTLKNTARWQLSSSLLHGFMGALQGAYGYAQDLNQSLNNIRIVTGQSIDQMAKFADEANRAARELSTTTTRYTDAALIYYQQGLTGKAVTDRVEATVKLANVSRQSAEEVSSQMTAIWNNFDDGSKKLEYYADVITALGAATASSSDEIAQGLQKFAAVADTVGLSYEKATAALATVVAETRQSADVVGTAFKTMFARFQGVTLGETLEDGVGLNKYSKALATVGVDILEANGNLKDMDTILDELGEKWNQIGNAQQVALAETVAGTRQYAQFMAIMENYDKILANQQLGAGAEGTLEKQAQIYAESWEAARDRVKAALQGIYSQLLDDNAFISGLSGLEKFISAVGGAIKGLGGLKSILLIIGSIITSKYANEMPAIMQKLAGNFSVLTGAAEKNRIKMLEDANAIIQQMNAAEAGTKGFQAQIGAMQLVSKMTTELEQKKNSLSKAEIANYEQKIKEVQIYGQIATAIGQEIDALEKEAAAQKLKLNSNLFSSGNLTKKYYTAEEQKKMASLSEDIEIYKNIEAATRGQTSAGSQKKFKDAQQNIKQLESELKNLQKTSGTTGSQLVKDFSAIAEKAGKMTAAYNETSNRAKNWQQALQSSNVDIAKTKEEILAYADIMQKAGFNVDEFKKAVSEASSADQLQDALLMLTDTDRELAYQTYDVNQQVEKMKQSLINIDVPEAELNRLESILRKSGESSQEYAAALEQVKQKYAGLQPHTISTSEQLSRLGSAAMSVASAINAIKNLGNIWNDEDASTGEKIVQTLMAMGMLLPAINALLDKQTLSALKASFSLSGLAAANTADAVATGAATGATIAFGTALKALPIGWVLTALAGLIGLIALIAKKIETPAEKLERLKKEQEELNEATAKAKEEWQEFNNTITNYDEAITGLKHLTEGTKDFVDQLEKANSEADELIKTIGLEFGKDYYFDQNGLKIFTQAGRDAINTANENAKKGAAAAEWAQLISANETDRAEYENKYGKSQIYNEDTLREQEWQKLNSKYNTSINQRLYGEISNLLKDGMTANDIVVSNAEELAREYGLANDQKDNIIRDVAKIINAASYNSPFQTNYNQEQAWIASQLDLSNPFSQIVAKNIINEDAYNTLNQSKIQEYNALDEQAIEDEWEKRFGALSDKGASFAKTIEEKRKFLANADTGQGFVDLANQNLDAINQQANKFSDKNKDILTNIILGSLEKISPEDIKNLQLTEAEKQAFAEIQNQLYGKSLQAADTDQIVKDLQEKTYDPAKFYRNQLKGIESIQESIKTLNKELGSLKLGDVIDPEIYNNLSDGMQSYFAMMEDGTYKLIGNAEEFQSALFYQKTGTFKDELENFMQLAASSPTWTNYTPSVNEFGEMTLQSVTTHGLSAEDTAKMQGVANAYAMAADSLEQLNYVIRDFDALGITQSMQTEAIDASLQELATKYDTCTDELESFQQALILGDAELTQASRNALEFSLAAAEIANSTGFSAKEIESQAKRINQHITSEYKSIKNLTKASTDWAVASQRLSRGINDLSKNLEDNKEILSKGQVTTVEYSQAMDETRQSIADVFNVANAELLDDSFILRLMNDGDLDLIAQGGDKAAEAIERLQKDVAKDILINIKARFEGTEIADQIQNFIDTQIPNVDLTVGTHIEGTDAFVTELNKMIAAAGMTKEEITSLLGSMGMSASLHTDYQPQTRKAPITVTEVTPVTEWVSTGIDASIPGFEGLDKYPVTKIGTYTYTAGYTDVTEMVPVYSIETSSGGYSSGGGIDIIGTTTPPIPADTGKGGKSGGGSSSKSQQTSQKQYKNVTDESERYHVLNKQLEDLSKAYEKASKAKDRLFGKNKLQAIKDEMKALEGLIKHNQAYLSAIGIDLEKDKNSLINGGLTKDWVDSQGNLQHYKLQPVNIGLQFDEYGNVLNYDEYMQYIVQAYNDAVDKYNQDIKQEGLEDDAKEVIEDTFKQAELQYELALEALKQYEDTNEKFQEKLEEIRDSAREAQDKRLEEWSYQLELRIKVNDEDKRYLEYFRKSLQRFAKDAFAPVTELLSYWNSNGGDSDWKLMKISADTIKSATEDLLNASHGDPIIDPNTGEILQDFEYSQADWMSSLDECEDKIYEQIDAIYELDDTMSHYYAETLSEAETQLDQYMTKMEDCTAVLKHFQAISDLLGKETNYEWIEQILAAERETIQNELESATKEYELAKQQYDTMLARYEADKNSVDEGTRQLMEQELQAQYESMSKWQEKMLSKTEEYAELLNSIYENAIKKIGKAFEDAATKDLGWESLLNSMDRVAAYQDLILTRTNQVYETNKLMNQLSQDIDKTTNTAAKTKLNNFKQEIQDMQNLNVMSKFDLDVAKARYEILKAQIALEDAQNAKSTVRLQRDNEGNYGYVYTADQNDIDNAKQALEDKQNDLYNLTLEKANENAKALAQLDQEMYAELERISLLYKDDEEKMLQERQRIIEEYSQRRSVLVKDYATADYWQQQVSVTQTNEAYGDFYKQNLLDTDEWRAEVSTMVESIDTAYDSWTNDMDTYVRPTVGQNLEELQAKTEDLTVASENFQAWFDDFAATNAQRLDAIAAITHEYFLQRQEVEALIADLQRMAEAINNARAQEAGVERGVNNTTQSDLAWDPNTDYSALMADYLKNGGSQEDQQYQTWKAQREAKISGMNLQENYYGSRGSQFDENVQIYADNNLTGTIQDAIDALKENTEAVEQSDLSNLSSYASGGYTGTWGSSGKLALLHEKELVLNAADTENILSAVGLIREFNSAIDMRAAASSAMSALNPGSYEAGMQTIQQEVTIHAEFPNATNHNEIEEAFDTLINRASQYANRF